MEAHYINAIKLVSNPREPRHYKGALQSGKQGKWKGTIKSELNNFYSRGVWTKFPWSKLNGRKPLGNCWVFKKEEQTKQQHLLQRVDCCQRVCADTPHRLYRVICTLGNRQMQLCASCLPSLYTTHSILEVVDVDAAFLEADLDEQSDLF